MINIKPNAITVIYAYCIRSNVQAARGGSLRTQWQLQRSGYMLAYCVFNASSAAVSLYQPLTVKFLKNTGLRIWRYQFHIGLS